MKIGPYALLLNRSGGLFSLLGGRMNCARSNPGWGRSCGTETCRSWPGIHLKNPREAFNPSQRCTSPQQEGDGMCVRDPSRRVEVGDVPQTTLSIRVKSPQEMEEAGAFFGKDSQEGDAVLLWGSGERKSDFFHSCHDPEPIGLMKYLLSKPAITERTTVSVATANDLQRSISLMDLGTGKTCFARGFIRARVADPHLVVTSPSYLLDNTYEMSVEDVTIHHVDLYRLQGGVDLHVLDIPRVLETCVCLVEWPDRLGTAMPVDRLDVHLAAVNEDERIVTLTGRGDWWAGAVDEWRCSRETTDALQ